MLQLSWLCAWWNVLGPTLYSEDLAPYFWSLVYYFVGPWLIVACNYFAHRLSTNVDFQDSTDRWYHAACGSPCLMMAPDAVPLKCIRLSMNRMVLFCLLLAKCAVWTLPRALVLSLRRSRPEDSAHWLVEALDLLQESTNYFEPTWQAWSSWRKLYTSLLTIPKTHQRSTLYPPAISSTLFQLRQQKHHQPSLFILVGDCVECSVASPRS